MNEDNNMRCDDCLTWFQRNAVEPTINSVVERTHCPRCGSTNFKNKARAIARSGEELDAAVQDLHWGAGGPLPPGVRAIRGVEIDDAIDTRLLDPQTYVPLPITRINAGEQSRITILSHRTMIGAFRLMIDVSPKCNAGEVLVSQLSFGQELVSSAPDFIPAAHFALVENPTRLRHLLPWGPGILHRGTQYSLIVHNCADRLVTITGAVFGALEHRARFDRRMVNRLDNLLIRVNRDKHCNAIAPDPLHGAYLHVGNARCLLHHDHEGDHYAYGVEWS